MTSDIQSLQSSRNFVLLAPRGAPIPGRFSSVHDDSDEYSKLIDSMQQLRGRVYLEDGAITPSELDFKGRHHMPGDKESWHLLRIRPDGSVSGCARILVHPRDVSFSQLRLASSALAKCATWGRAVRANVESEIAKARKLGQSFTEPGGWALAEDLRGSTEALSIVVGVLAWGQLFGGGVGFMTATVRHGSSTILRRLGGSPVDVEGRPATAYFDPAYGCDMELLRFDCQKLNPRFGALLDRTRRLLMGAPVIVASSEAAASMAA
jgi:hypothetical protein